MKSIVSLSFLLFIVSTSYGQDIPSVTIGTQTWMSKNLESKSFQNGSPIRHANEREDFVNSTEKGEALFTYNFYNDPEAT
jgi:hypothetical protein